MNGEPECYAKMFPPVVEMDYNNSVTGKVFGYEMDYPGQLAHRRDAIVNREAWRKCLACSHFDGCYRLSTGLMLMELAVKSSPHPLY
jgi:hypothetical protein